MSGEAEERRQLQPGARELADQLAADVASAAEALERIRYHALVARQKIRLNPGLALDHLGYLESRCDEIDDLLGHLGGDLHEHLLRLLRRRAALDAIDEARQRELATLRDATASINALLAALRPSPIPFDRSA